MTVPFPFIVGRGRSGTTLLRAMFDSHPEMAIPGESHFVAPMVLRRGRYETVEGFALPIFLSDLFRHPRYRLWGLPDEVVSVVMTEEPPEDLAGALRRVFALYAESRGKRRYGDKTPIYVIHMSILADLFPEARFVHVIRDGRDVALSYRDVDFGSRSLAESAIEWKRWVAKGRKAGEGLGAKRYREVRYEDLIDDPEGILRVLCGFVEVDYDPVMLQYPGRAEDVARGSAFPHAHGRLALPPTKGLRDWRHQMSDGDIALFEALAGNLLSELGYERATDRPNIRTRLHAIRGQLVLETKRATHGMSKKLRSVRGR